MGDPPQAAFKQKRGTAPRAASQWGAGCGAGELPRFLFLKERSQGSSLWAPVGGGGFGQRKGTREASQKRRAKQRKAREEANKKSRDRKPKGSSDPLVLVDLSWRTAPAVPRRVSRPAVRRTGPYLSARAAERHSPNRRVSNSSAGELRPVQKSEQKTNTFSEICSNLLIFSQIRPAVGRKSHQEPLRAARKQAVTASTCSSAKLARALARRLEFELRRARGID